ncbi:TetR/AcrR family transcriptional regulator [Amycolatopsis sp. FDAARGOS 1241]|uniref:TetR/AcrR family transcriptional regulator n=1 Tax=Amycolatopsis sp. FDAARGOS 1241 TaxID=2778070 RepID=UPI00194EB823|nr:TetR family transcriptional regulator [Amycolatopsis sp. FDAARGOS 1241]QRP44905.1 TetR family transcriptional regulator [Amycolatopsis sp. FDAARGOS 1241]
MDRISVLGDAAIEVIAAEGMRGLTHRAVDRAAGLPAGSTSYYARTRRALLELAMARMVELDEAVIDACAKDLADVLAATVHAAITVGRSRMLARYEFALEATRRPELRAAYDEGGRTIRDRCVELLAAAGSPQPERHTRVLLNWLDGSIFYALAGAGSTNPPDRMELADGARAVLKGLGLPLTR